MNYGKSHDNHKIQEKCDTKGLVRSPHPSYSPDLSPCDFWFLGMGKGTMRDREFHAVQVILGRVTEVWNGLTFEDVQRACFEWQIRLNWVVENGGEHYSE
jgi:hypothetical protein